MHTPRAFSELTSPFMSSHESQHLIDFWELLLARGWKDPLFLLAIDKFLFRRDTKCSAGQNSGWFQDFDNFYSVKGTSDFFSMYVCVCVCVCNVGNPFSRSAKDRTNFFLLADDGITFGTRNTSGKLRNKESLSSEPRTFCENSAKAGSQIEIRRDVSHCFKYRGLRRTVVKHIRQPLRKHS